MLKTVKIELLKSKMKSAYLEHDRILDSFSCGRHLAEAISPRLAHEKNIFNDCLAKLRKIDDTVPSSIKPL